MARLFFTSGLLALHLTYLSLPAAGQAILSSERIDTWHQSASIAFPWGFVHDYNYDDNLALASAIYGPSQGHAHAQCYTAPGLSDFVPSVDTTLNVISTDWDGEWDAGAIAQARFRVNPDPNEIHTSGTLIGEMHFFALPSDPLFVIDAKATIRNSQVEVFGHVGSYSFSGHLADVDGVPVPVNFFLPTTGFNELFYTSETISVNDTVDIKAQYHSIGLPIGVESQIWAGASISSSYSIY